MKYKEIKPCEELVPFIHAYWELKGGENDKQWERNFPDGCPGLVFNPGATCITDNGSISMEFGRTYVVGTMTSFKDSFIHTDTHLMGVCFKPTTFSNFYDYAPQDQLTDNTIEFEKSNSFNIDKILKDPSSYLNRFFTDRIRSKNIPLQSVIQDIHNSKGQLSVYELSKRNYTSLRQLERSFKIQTGISPKKYSNIVRFQNALDIIKKADKNRSLLDIAFECGFYDHSHLANEIKRNTGLSPSEL